MGKQDLLKQDLKPPRPKYEAFKLEEKAWAVLVRCENEKKKKKKQQNKSRSQNSATKENSITEVRSPHAEGADKKAQQKKTKLPLYAEGLEELKIFCVQA